MSDLCPPGSSQVQIWRIDVLGQTSELQVVNGPNVIRTMITMTFSASRIRMGVGEQNGGLPLLISLLVVQDGTLSKEGLACVHKDPA